MKELLEKWAELEPDRCTHRGGSEWCVMVDKDWHCLLDYRYLGHSVRIGVQQAIEARGWDWSMATTQEPTYRLWHASVKCNHDSTIWEPQQYSDNCSTEALLSVYLAALQATAEEVAG